MEPYYVTTPIYYVNSTPHIGHAYTTVAADVFARHQRQRGRDTFLLTGVDEHASKVARVAEEQGLAPQEYADRIVEAWRALPARLGVAPRLLHPHERRRAQAVRPGVPARGSGTTVAKTSTRTSTPGSTASAARRSRPRTSSSTGSAPSTTSSPSGSRSGTGSSGSRPTRSSCSRSTTSGPTSCCPAFRANEARSFIAGGLQDFSISREGLSVGDPDPVGHRPGRVRLGGRARQLPERATYARPGEDLVPRYWPGVAAPAGEGHPALPLRLLAGDAARGGLRRAAPALRARVSPARRSQDLEVARERRRPARPGRRLRRRCRAVLVRALGLVRPGRRGVGRRACASATSASSGTTSAISSRGRPRWSRDTADGSFVAVPSADSEIAAILEPLGERRRRAPRRLRPDGGARADLGGRARRSTGTSRRRRRGSSRRTRRARRSSTACSTTSSTGCAPWPSPSPPTFRRRRRGFSPRCGQPPTIDWAEVAYGRAQAVEGLEPAEPLFPRVDEPTLAA